MRRLSVMLALVVGLFVAASASAQTVTSGSRLAWDQAGQTVATATSATYKAYVDTSTTGVALAGVTCVVGVPSTTATCSANFPALTPGSHTIALTQSIGTAESLRSTPPFAFEYVVVVVPTNVRMAPPS